MTKLRRHKISKTTVESSIIRKGGRKELECKECHNLVEDLLLDVKSVICSICVARMVPPTEIKLIKRSDEKHPRGWHLKKQYVSPSGKVYSFGKEVK